MILFANPDPRARSDRLRTSATLLALCAVSIAACLWARPAGAAPTIGFVEDWPGVSLSGWIGGTLADNPGSGGVGGPTDGFLRLSSALPGRVGSASSGAEYAGDWLVAGISHVVVVLDDLGTADPMEIHFGIGRDTFDASPNFWQYDIGFIPPAGAWRAFDVDLGSASFTRIIGTGTLADALSNVKKIHLRHDLAPYFPNSPDAVSGDVGVDRLMLLNAPLAVGPGTRIGARKPVALAPPAPNPSLGPVTLTLETFEGGQVHLQIVDAAGRLMRSAELPDGPAGARSWTWDGTDDHGRALAPGVYRVRAWGPAGGTSRPLIRVR